MGDRLPDDDFFSQHMKCRILRATMEHDLFTDLAQRQLQDPSSSSQHQLLPHQEKKNEDMNVHKPHLDSDKKKQQASNDGDFQDSTNGDDNDSDKKKQRASDSDDFQDSINDDSTWPDGTLENVCMPMSKIPGPGMIPHFGWAFCQCGQKELSNGDFRRSLCCLGVYECTKCDFLARPLLPSGNDKKFGCPPCPPKHTCVVHRSDPLAWKQCAGGENGGPCKIIVNYLGGRSGEMIEFDHIGNHEHPKPPQNKPSPEALRKLQKIVIQNPDILPSKLHMGSEAHPPASELHEALFNKDRLGHHRRKIQNKKRGPQGIRGSMAALLSLAQDLPDRFFEINSGNPMIGSKPIIHLQSEFMRSILNNEEHSGFQSDTIEGVIYDLDHADEEISIHFTSGFDPVLGRWVPVLMSILFGRSANEYCDHWKRLLSTFKADNWKQFKATFPGITVDWSEGERKGHVKAFKEFAKEKFRIHNLSEDVTYEHLRKCDVHFKRSRQRVLQNGSIVPPKKKQTFRDLTDKLISGKTTNSEFRKTMLQLEREFPDALPWLVWHLDPRRAKSYFPACVDNDRLFKKMSKTTNAQENLGGQFQDLFGSSMTLNEATLNLWKFVNRFDIDHQASLKGLSNKHSQHPRVAPKSRKRKMQKNDGRGPDTTEMLKAAKKGRKMEHHKKAVQMALDKLGQCETADGKFHGISWSFQHKGQSYANTCPLDSFLSLLFILHKGKLMVHPLVELSNHKSLLAKAFKELDEKDPMTGGINARMLFIDKWHKRQWLEDNRYSLFSSLDVFFHENDYAQAASKTSPIFQSTVWECTRATPACTLGDNCQHPDGPQHAIPREKRKQMTSFSKTTDDGVGNMDEEVMKRIIDAKFSSYKTSTNCGVEYFETGEVTEDGRKKKESRVTCPGYQVCQKAEIKRIAHLAVFDQGEGPFGFCTGITGLADVPFQFVCMEKRWVFRGAILGDGAHFTSVARLPNCWMHYDGMKKPMLQIHPLDSEGSMDAMHNRGLAHLFYEVLELDEESTFGSAELDHSTVFHYDIEDEGGKEKEFEENDEEKVWDDDNQVTSGQDDVGFPVVETVVGTSSDDESSENNSQGGRIPPGWSIRMKRFGKRGPLPQCKGCRGDIKRDATCLRCSYTAKRWHSYPTVDQCHCKVGCLQNLDKTVLKKLTQKHWTDQRVATVTQKIDRKMSLSP